MLFLDKTPDLSELEYDIYQYVIEHTDTIDYMSVRELAQATHTSTASVIRFCKAFGCGGYSEFKYRYKQHRESFAANNQLKQNDETALINFLSNTSSLTYQEKMTSAVRLLKDKELILFVGTGSSKLVAAYGAHYFSSLFSMAMVIEDTMNYPVNHLSSDLAKKTAIIVLSVSGENAQIIDFINRYHTTKCSVISITNSSKSTIAKLSDVNFSYFIAQERVEYSDVTSQVPAIYILESLGKTVRSSRLQPAPSKY